MREIDKTKDQLLVEISKLKTKVFELEKSNFERNIWLENSPVCTKILDPDFNLHYMSHSGIRKLKIHDISAFYGKPYPFSYFPDALKTPMTKSLIRARDNKEVVQLKAPIPDTEGNLIWFHATIVPVVNFEGQLDHMMVVSSDVTSQVLMEEEIVKTKHFYEDIIEGVQDGIWVTDENDIIHFANKGMENIAGIPREEIQGKNVLIDFPEETTGEFIAFYKQAKEKKEAVWYNIKVKTPAGRNTWQNGWLIPKYKENNFLGIICTIRDVSDQKETETALKESEEKYRAIVENSHDAIYIYKDNRFLFVNDKTCELSGYTREDFERMIIWDIVHPEDRKRVEEYGKKRIAFEEAPDTYQSRIIAKNNELRFCEFSVRLIPYQNDFAVLGAVKDITEKKKAEQALIQSEQKYRSYFEKDISGIYLSTPQGKLLDCNQAFTKMLGYSTSEILQIDTTVLYPYPVNRAEFINKLTSKKNLLNAEIDLVCKDGQIINCIENVVGIFNEEGKLIQFQGYVLNITDRNKALTKLKQSEARYKSLVETASDAIYLITEHGIIVDTNQSACVMLGRSKDEFIGSKIDFIDPNQTISNFKKYWASIPFNEQTIFETNHLHKDGNSIPVEVSAIKHKLNEEVFYYGIARDISDRKQATEDIQESRDFLDKIINSSSSPIFVKDMNHEVCVVNDAFCSLLGSPREKIIGTNGFEFFSDEQVEKFIKNDQQVFNTGKEIIAEELYTGTNGEVRKFTTRKNVFTNANGNKFLVGILSDITELKKIEKSLLESEARFKALHNASFGGIAIHDKGMILDCNKGLAEISGYKFSELIGKDGLLLIAEESRDMVMEKILSEYEKPYEAIGIKKNGEKYPIRLEARMIPYKGQTARVVEFRDITESKKAEKELRQSEFRFSELVDTIGSGVAVYKVTNDGLFGSDYIIQDFNKAALMMEGLPKDKVIGKNLLELRPSIDEFGIIPIFRKVWKSGKEEFFPAKNYKDNKYDSYYENRIYKLPSGEIVAVYDDVTARENAALKIAESRQRFDLAMEATKDGLYDWNLLTNDIYYSPGWKSMLGYTDDELPNDFSIWEKLIKTKDAETSWKMQQELINKKRDRFELELKMKHKAGHWVNILSRAEAVFDEDGNAIRIVGTHVDISDRKKSEEEIYRLKKAVDDSFFGVVMAALDGNNFYMNDAAYKLFGYNPEQDALEGSRSGVGWADPLSFDVALKQILAYGAWEGDIIAKRKDGSFFDCYVSATVIKNLDGKPQHIIANYLDITERKKAEKAIKESEEKYHGMVMNLIEGFYNATIEGELIEYNVEFLKILGLDPKKDYRGLELPNFWKYPKARKDYISQLLKKGFVKNYIVDIVRPDASQSIIQINSRLIKDESGNSNKIEGTFLDYSDRFRAEELLKQSEDQLRKLTVYMDTKTENEKKIIAKQIHDGLGQLLTGLKMDLQWIRKKHPIESGILKDKFTSMNNIIDSAVHDVQKLTFSLRPKMLDDLGLVATIQSETEHFEERTGISCTLRCNPETFDVEYNRSSAIYRIIMELLTNIFRHANATKINIRLEKIENKCIFTVKDNGLGITQDQIDSKNSFGLISIIERTKVWSGTVKVKGFKNKGTTVFVSIPLS